MKKHFNVHVTMPFFFCSCRNIWCQQSLKWKRLCAICRKYKDRKVHSSSFQHADDRKENPMACPLASKLMPMQPFKTMVLDIYWFPWKHSIFFLQSMLHSHAGLCFPKASQKTTLIKWQSETYFSPLIYYRDVML